MSTGDAAQMRGDAERHFLQSKEERSKLEEKLTQVEKNALLTLTHREQIHREQLEAERQQNVEWDGSSDFKPNKKYDFAVISLELCVCLHWLTGAAVCGADGSAGAGHGAAAHTV